MEGIYAIYFTGITGSGQGLLVLKGGIVAGADVTGGLYDGEYAQQDNIVKGSVKLTLPPGAMLVTGASAGTEPMEIDIPLELPADLGNSEPMLIKTSTGPVNVIFKRLRDVP